MSNTRKLRRIYHKLNKKRINPVKVKQLIKKDRQSEEKKIIKTFMPGGISRQFNAARDSIKPTGGFLEVGEGFIIQWGRVYNDTDDTQSFTFKRKFNTCFGVVLNRQNKNSSVPVYATNITSSGFEIARHSSINNSYFVNYMAMGY